MIESWFYSITNTAMTDIVNDDSTDWEKVLSDFAKLRASLKTKYEWQIKELQKEIDNLKWQRLEDKKMFLENSLNSQGYKLDDFDEFTNKYWEMELEEMEALYKWMHGAVVTNSSTTTESQQTNTIWPKSVIWSNPSLDWEAPRPEDMNLDDYFNYAQSLLR